MQIEKTKKVLTTRLIGMRCDRCGTTARIDGEIADQCALREFLSVDFVAGYGAKAFDDGTRYSCELCEVCVKELLGEFLRPTEIQLLGRAVDVHHANNPFIES